MGRGEKGEKEGVKRKGKEGRRSKRQKEFDTRREAGKERGWKYGEIHRKAKESKNGEKGGVFRKEIRNYTPVRQATDVINS